ncbi:MAG: glycoside hydrolase [Flavobacteriaceae bacterium]|nr:glycoside hydrolase [Flavobacteriaceae bacterium]|tara:strand:+ start:20310 stop:21338 length:1029 start_codon:yes stop_codon:yes gene_type:complete
MTILYLYAELMGYQIPVLKEYTLKYNANVHVVHWDHKKLTPYIPPKINNVHYYNRSSYDYEALLQLVKEIKPDISFISGWMDNTYLKIGKILKNNSIPVVAGCDTQASNSIKHKIGYFIFRFTYKKFFTHIWVAGPYQYEYARKLGFKKNQIIFNLYSADVNSFGKNKNNNFAKKFLFLGRFEEIKGINILLEAWRTIQNKKDWSLTFIGNGKLVDKIKNEPNIVVKDFMQPHDLINEIHQYGFMILPSLDEPWALVIHEAMSAGIPVLSSDVCGAAPVFILPNYTGFTFKSEDVNDLISKITTIMNMEEDILKRMSINAKARSTIITPEIVAASFISTLNS